MLAFFPEPYEDELLYGLLSRYHFYSGNIDFKDTLRELFGKGSLIPRRRSYGKAKKHNYYMKNN